MSSFEVAKIFKEYNETLMLDIETLFPNYLKFKGVESVKFFDLLPTGGG
jgi:hypothetical protein